VVAVRGVRPPAWLGYLGAVAVAIGFYYLLPLFGPGAMPAHVVTYAAVSWSAVVALAVGMRRHRPRKIAPWLLLAVGQALTASGELVFDITYQLLHSDAEVSLADPLYLSAYPLLAAGLLLLVRYRTPGWHLPSLTDAGIIAISAGLLSWMFVISPSAFSADLSPLARAVTTAYPVMDLLLLAVAARLLLGAGTRTPAFRLLSAGLILLLASDTAYAVQDLLGSYSDGNYLDAGWLLAAALIGAAGLHPSMTELTRESPATGPDATPGRLVVLAVAALLAPAAMLTQYLRHADLFVPLACGACMALFLLVIVRMAGLVQAQRHMAITDALTGLRTRRYLEQALANESARAQGHHTSIGLLLLDVDHFKQVNDTHGHHGGDRVLCEIARRLSALSRPGDVVARYGGEEFAILLPQTGAADLTAIGERIRRGIASTPIAVDPETLITVTVSIGASLLPDHVEAAADLTLTADRALYAAKEAGRNRLVTTRLVA
jgi:diguanylate cyclase (GGDEF)-like protein